MPRVFILSPARSNGVRAKFLLNPCASFDLALKLRDGRRQPIGEVFSFLSGLYFRGKLAYARQFAQPSKGGTGVWVITSDRGLVTIDTPIGLDDLRAFSEVPIAREEPRYQMPLKRDIARLQNIPDSEFVLLGSISTDKYVDALLEGLGEKLLFPIDFVGRGDMSRGGLLLRCCRELTELPYAPVAGAVRQGRRPARLAPLRKAKKTSR